MLDITFKNDKTKRHCEWLLKNFARVNALVLPKTAKDQIDLHKQRGLEQQYRDPKGSVYFATEQGWKAFLEFIEVLHMAEPFRSSATYSEVYQAFSAAFATMLSARLLPESLDDLVLHLPDDFLKELTRHGEITFFKLNGIRIDTEFFLNIGHCWVGNFGKISFEAVQESERKECFLDVLRSSFEENTPVITGGRIRATTKGAKREDALRSELGLAILDVLLNMTYKNAFLRLWSVRRVERPEHGLAKQFSFKFVDYPGEAQYRELSLGIRFTEQTFDVDEETIDRWHKHLLLGELNKIIGKHPDDRSDIEDRLINSLLYFRQASLQVMPEMQMSILWICVEALFTGNSEQILKVNLLGLLAMTIWSLRKEYWPSGATTYSELKKVFNKFYCYRSRTFHHGKRGHVTASEVQHFSVVVNNIIIGVTQLIDRGYMTSKQLVQASKEFVESLEST